MRAAIGAVLVALLARSCGGGSSGTPTAPTPSPTPSAPAPAPPAATATLAGRVLSPSGFPVRGATITALDGASNGRTVTTDSAGAYRFDNLQQGNTNFSAGAVGCREDRKGILVNGTGSLDFTLPCDTVPVLLSPAEGATLDNGCMVAAALEPQIWTFDWSDVPGVTAYNLHVIGRTATAPIIDNPNIQASEFERNQPGFIIQANSQGWQWRVRARIGDTFGEWSVVPRFDVEPEGTDCQPMITSISPSDVTTGRQTITLNGNYLIPGVVTATDPNGRTDTANAVQESIGGRFVIQANVTDPGRCASRRCAASNPTPSQ